MNRWLTKLFGTHTFDQGIHADGAETTKNWSQVALNSASQPNCFISAQFMLQWKSNEVHTEIGPLACSLPLKVCAIIIIRWVDWVVGGSSFHPGPGSCTVQDLSLAKTLQRYPDQIFGVSMPFVGQCLPHHTDTGVKRPRIVQFEIALCAAPKECYSYVDVKIMPARICDLTLLIMNYWGRC